MKGVIYMNRVDFHTHSTCSDGLLTPTEMVHRAFRNDVQYFSLTDHDTVSGLYEAKKEAEKLGVKFIPGIELSTSRNKESIHILGYFTDESYMNPEFIKFLDELKNMRYYRAKAIVEKLKTECNINISFEKVVKRGQEVVARPHIAYEIMDCGYPYDMSDIFDNFIGKGCPAYVSLNRISTEEGISILKKYNALAFLAHPILIKDSSLEDFAKMDFDGIEAVYYQNTDDQEKFLVNFAKEHNLLISAGSDCHGNFTNDPRHGDIGSMNYKEEYLDSFLRALRI